MEKYSTTAKVIDGTLILTLPDAVRPVVWQMQLGQTKSSALEVREQGDTWLLVLKTPRADVLEIAPFATKALAVRALMAVSRAMERAQGQLGPYGGVAAYPVPALRHNSCLSWLGRLLKWIACAFLALVAVLVIAYTVLWLLSPSASDVGVDQNAAYEAPLAPPAPVGTPESADDFLDSQN